MDARARIPLIGFIPDNGRVHVDGVFELKGITGRVRLDVVGLPDGWTVRAVEVNGNELRDREIDPEGQALTKVTLTITGRFPSITGQVTDKNGRATASGIVITLSVDDGSESTSANRTARVARVDQTGHYVVDTLPPGTYIILALSSVDAEALDDQDFADSLRRIGRRITVVDGERKHLDIVLQRALSPV